MVEFDLNREAAFSSAR